METNIITNFSWCQSVFTAASLHQLKSVGDKCFATCPMLLTSSPLWILGIKISACDFHHVASSWVLAHLCICWQGLRAERLQVPKEVWMKAVISCDCSTLKYSQSMHSHRRSKNIKKDVLMELMHRHWHVDKWRPQKTALGRKYGHSAGGILYWVLSGIEKREKSEVQCSKVVSSHARAHSSSSAKIALRCCHLYTRLLITAATDLLRVRLSWP